MVLDFAKEAIQNASTHSINFDEFRAGKIGRISLESPIELF